MDQSTSDAAAGDVIITCEEIDALLRKIYEHRKDMFGIDAENVSYADVGSVKRVRDLLAEAVAFIERNAE